MRALEEKITIDYARADVWKKRAKAASKAEKLARQAVKDSLKAMKDKAQSQQLVVIARQSNEAAALASKEAEGVWRDTAADL